MLEGRRRQSPYKTSFKSKSQYFDEKWTKNLALNKKLVELSKRRVEKRR